MMMVKILKYNIRFVYIYNIYIYKDKERGYHMIFKFNKNIRVLHVLF